MLSTPLNPCGPYGVDGYGDGDGWPDPTPPPPPPGGREPLVPGYRVDGFPLVGQESGAMDGQKSIHGATMVVVISMFQENQSYIFLWATA